MKLVRKIYSFFITCSKSSSTGVSRSKIDTITVTFPLDLFTSEIVPSYLANGPSFICTRSPSVSLMSVVGESSPMRRCISPNSSGSTGTGIFPDPTNPVTFGVFRTMNHEASVTIISTSTYPEKRFRSVITLFPFLIDATFSFGTRTLNT